MTDETTTLGKLATMVRSAKQIDVVQQGHEITLKFDLKSERKAWDFYNFLVALLEQDATIITIMGKLITLRSAKP